MTSTEPTVESGEAVTSPSTKKLIPKSPIQSYAKTFPALSVDPKRPPTARAPLIIGVCGQSGSGKTTVCERIRSEVHPFPVRIVSMDSFYKSLSPGSDPGKYDFDHPDALDIDAYVKTLRDLADGLPASIPEYSFTSHQRVGELAVEPTSVIIAEGILLFHDPRVRALLHIKIFVDTDSDECLRRRIKRDIAMRGRSLDSVLEQYFQYVRPSVKNFVAPSRIFADMIIPRGFNPIAVDLIKQNILAKLKSHPDDPTVLYPQVQLVPHSLQIKHVLTILRDRSTTLTDFVFYADRLTRIVLEHALGVVSSTAGAAVESDIITPTGECYRGVSALPDSRLAAVSVVRGGEAMEPGLRAVSPAVPIGKILFGDNPSPATDVGVSGAAAALQAVDEDGEHSFHQSRYVKLPLDIKTRTVLLLDPVVARGKQVASAIRELVERGVDAKDLVVVCLIANQVGIRRILRLYPEVTIVAAEVDPGLSEEGLCLPGIGNFATRYFGCEEM
eukprot:TRINITY_DN44100_c0_g1_i1.p1 TRINITY_DN44100_c0_g1~~TRINITY_DN44100_c0_g1_i1.p1  ORF type:complete len:501 (-),score=123.10 TRINITY_DN44100_c0_g1_i1:619-2121(-)